MRYKIMNLVDNVIAYEAGELSEEETIEFFQYLVTFGIINQLQGHYQRTAADLVELGLISA